MTWGILLALSFIILFCRTEIQVKAKQAEKDPCRIAHSQESDHRISVQSIPTAVVAALQNAIPGINHLHLKCVTMNEGKETSFKVQFDHNLTGQSCIATVVQSPSGIGGVSMDCLKLNEI